MPRIKIFNNSVIPQILLITILVALLYGNILDNPFIHDDYLWLYSGKKLASGDWTGFSLGISTPYHPFFINGLFGICFKLFGLNYEWYHAISLSIHLFNSTLLYWLVSIFFKDYLWAFLAALLFSINPIISNAIIWPSAWVDLFAAFGFLISIISYKLFLDKDNPYLYILAMLCFIVSIFSKIIGIGLPVMLIIIEFSEGINKATYKKTILRVALFALISLIYIFSVFHKSTHMLEINWVKTIFNLFRYIPAMFITEGSFLGNKIAPVILTCLLLGLLIFLYLRHKKEIIFIASFIILTVFPLTALDFSLKSPMMLASISHRLYLPAIGFQMLMGFIVVRMYSFLTLKFNRNKAIGVIFLICTIYIIWGGIKINKRERAWDFDSKNIFDLCRQLKSKRENFPANSLVYLLNVPSSGAFWEPMVRLYYNDSSVDVSRYPIMLDFNRYQNVYEYLYLYGYLLDDHPSIIRLAKIIKTEDIGFIVKFYDLKGWHKEKIEVLQEISTFAFKDADMHYRLAFLYKEMNMLDEAENEFRGALIVTPHDTSIHNDLGLLYLQKREYGKALEEFETVTKDGSSPAAPMAAKFIKYIKKKID